MVDRLYATSADLAKYEGLEIDDDMEATRLIRKASMAVHRQLKTALYDTDDNGMPTNPDVIDTLAMATAAQVQFFEETGDTTGVSAQATGGSIGSVSLPSVKSDGGAQAKQESLVSPEMLSILRGADCLDWDVSY